MSAAAQRAAFADIGRELLAARGNAGERRAAALLARAEMPPPAQFERLSAVPDWLRWSPERQMALANAVALRAIAPALALSIDGGWLGGLARVAGENALDWAVARGAEHPNAQSKTSTALVPDDLTAVGFATLRAALPLDLRGYVHGPAAEPLPADAAIIAEAVAFVRADAA